MAELRIHDEEIKKLRRNYDFFRRAPHVRKEARIASAVLESQINDCGEKYAFAIVKAHRIIQSELWDAEEKNYYKCKEENA